MDKIVKIGRFTDSSDAQVLLSHLRAEGVKCHLCNGLVNQYSGMAGVFVEVREADLPQALLVMEENGYEIYNPERESENRINWLISKTNKIPLLKTFSNETQILVLLFLIASIATAILALFITQCSD